VKLQKEFITNGVGKDRMKNGSLTMNTMQVECNCGKQWSETAEQKCNGELGMQKDKIKNKLYFYLVCYILYFIKYLNN
jgi:hypothetical protein